MLPLQYMNVVTPVRSDSPPDFVDSRSILHQDVFSEPQLRQVFVSVTPRTVILCVSLCIDIVLTVRIAVYSSLNLPTVISVLCYLTLHMTLHTVFSASDATVLPDFCRYVDKSDLITIQSNTMYAIDVYTDGSQP